MKRGGMDLVVRVVRIAKRQTQEDLAKQNHVDRAIISNLESGKLDRPDLVFQIADRAGGVEMIDWLIDQLHVFREWFAANKRAQLLYA